VRMTRFINGLFDVWTASRFFISMQLVGRLTVRLADPEMHEPLLISSVIIITNIFFPEFYFNFIQSITEFND
jgi:hypothetical protein